MNEENNSQNPQEAELTSSDIDEERAPYGGVFDISNDNIQPAKETVETPSADILKKEVPIIVVKKPQPLDTKPEIKKEIPLQDLSEPLKKATAVGTDSIPNDQIMDKFHGGRVDTAETKPNTINPDVYQKKEEVETTENTEQTALKSIRTYESDVANVLSQKKTSTASIAIAENKKRDGYSSISTTEKTHTGKKLFIILLSLILIGVGFVGAYYLFSISPLAPAKIVQKPETASSIIKPDTQVVVSLDGLGPIEIKNKIQNEINKPQTENTIREIVFTEVIGEQTSRIAGPRMLELIDLAPPDILKRTIIAPWMFGVYADQYGKKSMFVVATTNFFQNAFAGMLQWEKVMADDLKPYLSSATIPINIERSVALSVSSSTSTSTAEATTSTTTNQESYPVYNTSYFTIKGNFEDRIVKNKDVRVFKTDGGEAIFLYSFIDTTKLLFTENDTVLAEILSRLEKQTLLR